MFIGSCVRATGSPPCLVMILFEPDSALHAAGLITALIHGQRVWFCASARLCSALCALRAVHSVSIGLCSDAGCGHTDTYTLSKGGVRKKLRCLVSARCDLFVSAQAAKQDDVCVRAAPCRRCLLVYSACPLGGSARWEVSSPRACATATSTRNQHAIAFVRPHSMHNLHHRTHTLGVPPTRARPVVRRFPLCLYAVSVARVVMAPRPASLPADATRGCRRPSVASALATEAILIVRIMMHRVAWVAP